MAIAQTGPNLAISINFVPSFGEETSLSLFVHLRSEFAQPSTPQRGGEGRLPPNDRGRCSGMYEVLTQVPSCKWGVLGLYFSMTLYLLNFPLVNISTSNFCIGRQITLIASSCIGCPQLTCLSSRAGRASPVQTMPIRYP